MANLLNKVISPKVLIGDNTNKGEERCHFERQREIYTQALLTLHCWNGLCIDFSFARPLNPARALSK